MSAVSVIRGEETTHAQGGPHQERRPRRPSRQREDLGQRGAAVPGRRHQPAGHGPGREHGLRFRPGRAGAPDVDQRVAELVRVGRPQDQPHRHPRRAQLRRRLARRPAGLRVGHLRDQRGHGRRGQRDPPLAARRGARPGADALRQHARPRARRLLPHPRVAEGRLRPPRGGHRDPDRLRARDPRRRGPRRHEGLRVRRRRTRQRARDPDPRRARGPGAGVPREAHGRGRRGLGRAHGALPRGRGDLPRGDRHRAEGRHQPRRDLPGGVRRGDQEPRHQPPARRDRRGPAEPGQARRPSSCPRSRSSPTRTRSCSPSSSRRRPTSSPGGSTSSASTRA